MSAVFVMIIVLSTGQPVQAYFDFMDACESARTQVEKDIRAHEGDPAHPAPAVISSKCYLVRNVGDR